MPVDDSSRYSEKSKLKQYVSQQVDPLVRACVIFLLDVFPEDLHCAMDIFLHHIQQSGQIRAVPRSSVSSLARSQLTRENFVRTKINPLMQKIAKSLSIHKPNTIVPYLIEILPKLFATDFPFYETKPWDTPILYRPNTAESALSNCKSSIRGFGEEDSLFRSRTSQISQGVPEYVREKLPLKAFMGGTVRVSLLYAEKFSGNGLIFGNGKFPSILQLRSQKTLGILHQEIVSTGCVSGESFTWSGYAFEAKTLILTPDIGAVLELIVFDCERSRKDDILGVALLDLSSIPYLAEFQCTLPIESVGPAAEANLLNPYELAADSLDIDAKSGVGSITLGVHFEPFKHYPMAKDQEYMIDITHMTHMSFSFGWSSTTKISMEKLMDEFGAAMLMFDGEGKFIDGVDVLQKRSRRGPPCKHVQVGLMSDRDNTADNDEINIHIKHKSRTFDSNKTVFYFFVFFAKHEFHDLSDIKSVYMRITDSKTKLPYGKYVVKPPVGASGFVMGRAWRSFRDKHVSSIDDDVKILP